MLHVAWEELRTNKIYYLLLKNKNITKRIYQDHMMKKIKN